jgi:hypothetical protein
MLLLFLKKMIFCLSQTPNVVIPSTEESPSLLLHETRISSGMFTAANLASAHAVGWKRGLLGRALLWVLQAHPM